MRELRSRTSPPVLPTVTQSGGAIQELVPRVQAADLATPTVEAGTSALAEATRLAATPDLLPTLPQRIRPKVLELVNLRLLRS